MVIDGKEYREIPNFSRYAISDTGEVYSVVRERTRMLHSHKDTQGYMRVRLLDDEGIRRTVKVHRAVALAWIPNPENKSEVHHKDENKSNNSVKNLAWVTHQENMHEGTALGRMTDKLMNNPHTSKQVVLTSVADGSELHFPSISEARRSGYRVDHVLQGYSRTTKGFTVKLV